MLLMIHHNTNIVTCY